MAHPRGARGNLASGWVAVAAVVVLAAVFRVMHPLDLRLLDTEFSFLRGIRSVEAVPEVALIGIDEKTLDAVPEPVALWHKRFGEVLLALDQVNPAAVGLDIVLPDRSYESVLPGSDRDLLRGLISARQRYPLVLGLTIDSAGNPRPVFPPFLAALGPEATGFVLVSRDSDGVVRRFDASLDEEGSAITFVGQIARRLKLNSASGIIDYSIGRPLEYIPMHEMLSAYRNHDMGSYRSRLEGKVVLVGSVLPLEDRVRQPINLAAWERGKRDAPGLLLHAQAVRSASTGLIREMPSILTVALAALGTLLWFASATPARAALILVALTAAVLGASLGLLARHWFLPVGILLLATWGAGLARLALEAMRRLRQRRYLRGALAGYVGPQIVEEVLAGRLAAELGGKRALICVMFTDIRGFTPRSEAMTPEAVVDLLNRYFAEVIECVHRHHGTVAQLMGDGLMAFFGAPNPLDNPSRAAFEAAQEMFGALAALNRRLQADGIDPIEIGVGLNTGLAIVGHVGAQSRHEYTATGDVVNVAARLEVLTKEIGYPLVCSEPVEVQLGDDIKLTALGTHNIKGHSSIPVYGWRKT